MISCFFDSIVFDTDFGADLTIMEEANEFVERVKNGGVLPIITSCSPGWVKFCEHFFPEFIPIHCPQDTQLVSPKGVSNAQPICVACPLSLGPITATP